jgi:hypothetical protein
MQELVYIDKFYRYIVMNIVLLYIYAANNQECFGCIFNVKRYIMIRSAFTGTCLCESN